MNFCAKSFDRLSGGEVYEILKARSKVFMIEQDIRCLDMDGVDYVARHYFFEEDGEVLAYLRAFYNDSFKKEVRIGRMLTVKRGVGLGAELIGRAIDDIKAAMGAEKLCLDAQKHAIGFYEKVGFAVVSDEFLEEGVVHVKMERLI